MATIIPMNVIRSPAISSMRVFLSLEISQSNDFPMKRYSGIEKSAFLIKTNSFKASRTITSDPLVAPVLAVRSLSQIAFSVIQSIAIYMVSLYGWIGEIQNVSMHRYFWPSGAIISYSVNSPNFIYSRPRILNKFKKIIRIYETVQSLCKLDISYAWSRKTEQMLSRFVILTPDRTLFIT